MTPPDPVFEPSAASALRLLAVPSARAASAAAEGERWAPFRMGGFEQVSPRNPSKLGSLPMEEVR